MNRIQNIYHIFHLQEVSMINTKINSALNDLHNYITLYYYIIKLLIIIIIDLINSANTDMEINPRIIL